MPNSILVLPNGTAVARKGTSIFARVSLSIMLTGCSLQSPQPGQLAEFQNTIPTCHSQSECDAKWSAARTWVLNNSAYKIQNYSADYLETYGGGNADTGFQVRVNKEIMLEGGYRIVVNVSCGNRFGCAKDPITAQIDFNTHVNQITNW